MFDQEKVRQKINEILTPPRNNQTTVLLLAVMYGSAFQSLVWILAYLIFSK